MGAMTMGASNDAVEWLLKMMVEMCPEVAEICIGTMSDLGKFTMVCCLVQSCGILILMTIILSYTDRCTGRASKKSTTKCKVLWCLYMAYYDIRLP